jgi:hypothetical protein
LEVGNSSRKCIILEDFEVVVSWNGKRKLGTFEFAKGMAYSSVPLHVTITIGTNIINFQLLFTMNN